MIHIIQYDLWQENDMNRTVISEKVVAR